VRVHEHRPDDHRLVAYVVPVDPTAGFDPEPLRASLRRSLPHTMIPAAIVALATFPVTSSGKLDTAALPVPEYAAARDGRPPATPAEELVASVWAQVLGLSEVGADDDFFDLGGHSLLATRIAARLSDVVRTEVPIHLVFSHGTVAGLAGALEDLLAHEIDGLSDEEAERELTSGTGVMT
jgi:hypothetical protein